MTVFTRILILSLAAVAVWLLQLSTPIQADDANRKDLSREISMQFGKQLKGELQAAMAAGGPVAAVDVCKDVAPGIAAALSRESGAKVRRTSLRFRNPANMPEPWEAEVLREFETSARGQSDGVAEFYATDEDGGARYLRAIPTAAVCLACHGEKLDPAIAEIIDREYPHDRARGYRVGDIRGAFSISWSPEEAL